MPRELTAQRMGEIALLSLKKGGEDANPEKDLFDEKPENVRPEILDMADTLGIRPDEAASFMAIILEEDHIRRMAQIGVNHAAIMAELGRIANGE